VRSRGAMKAAGPQRATSLNLYVLEGSVRKAGHRVRITAQLVDALSGAHLWANPSTARSKTFSNFRTKWR
jgi:TolB-like protein